MVATTLTLRPLSFRPTDFFGRPQTQDTDRIYATGDNSLGEAAMPQSFRSAPTVRAVEKDPFATRHPITVTCTNLKKGTTNAYQSLSAAEQEIAFTYEANMNTHLQEENILLFNQSKVDLEKFLKARQFISPQIDGHSSIRFELSFHGKPPQMQGINLHGCDVTPSVRGAKSPLLFSKTKLEKSDLEDADLTRADLSESTLVNARMSRSILVGTNFTGAKMQGANLSDTDLREAQFEGADLRDVNLRGALYNRLSIKYFEGAIYNLTFVQNLPDKYFEPKKCGMIFQGSLLSRAIASAIILYNRATRLSLHV